MSVVVDSESVGLPESADQDGPRDRSRVRSAVGVGIGRAVVLGLFGGAWELMVASGRLSSFYFSRPTAILRFLGGYISSGDVLTPLWATLCATLMAFVVGSVLGIVTGVLLAQFKLADRLAAPFITALNALPRIALAPLFILWFGIGISSKVYLGASLVFFVVLINTRTGILSVEPEYLRVVNALGANRQHRLRMVILPSVVPSVFSGLKIGLIYAMLGVIAGEMVASRTGLGQAVVSYSALFRTDAVLGVLCILSLLALTINQLVDTLETRLMSWRE